VKPTVIQVVEVTCAQNTPSDEQRAFYGGTTRMQRNYDTL